MTASASKDDEFGWKLMRRDSRGVCAYESVPDTTIVRVDFTQQSEPLPPGFGRLDDLLDELEADPELSAGLSKARRELATQLVDQTSLAALRLAQGLSQKDVADALGTFQPAISRLEAGDHEPKLGTLRRLATILKVDMNTLDRAFPA
jgi:DNA-binding XRE family transcriptional regulator